MRIGFWTENNQSWDDTLACAQAAETAGYDTVWYADHFMPFTGADDGPIHEAWAMLAGLAARVPRVRLGPLVTGNTYRHPAALMKMATTADHISGGRIVLGLGAGWQENEHLAYGFDYGTRATRSDRLEEACKLIVSLRDAERTDHAGEWYQLKNAPLSPKPLQARMPLVIGGKGPKRTLRTAAMYADEWNAWADPELIVSLGAILDRHCQGVGRDPSEIERTACTMALISSDQAVIDKMRTRDFGRPIMIGNPSEVQEMVAAYQAVGVAELIVPDFTYGSMPQRLEHIARFMEEVATPLGLGSA